MLARLGARYAALALLIACGEEAPEKILAPNAGGSPASGGAGAASITGGSPSGGASGSGVAPAGQGGTPSASGGSSGAAQGGAHAGSPQQTAGSSAQSGGASGSSGAGGAPAGGSAGAPAGGAAGAPAVPSGKTFVYVGTGDYGKAGAGKIRVYSLDETNVTLTSVGSAGAGTLPSYFALNPTGSALYAGDEDAGGLKAFSVAADGRLSALNSLATSGKPVYVSTDREARFVFTAHYNEGSVQVSGLMSSGQLGASVQSLSTGTQAHSIVLSPDGKYVFVPNKGSNYIASFKLESDGKLTPNTPPNVSSNGGPRHLTFHPSKPMAYVVHENGNTLRAFSYDASTGGLTAIDDQSILPSGSGGNSTAADVRVEPTGKFVYASNRADTNSTLAIFSIAPTDGKLTLVGHESTHGKTPRNFGIHPSGRILLVANVDSNNVAAFRLNPDTGALTFVGTTDVGDKAWCVGFAIK